MPKPKVTLSAMSYPMLRLAIECFLEQWQEITSDNIYSVDEHTKECADLLSDLFSELAKRVPQ